MIGHAFEPLPPFVAEWKDEFVPIDRLRVGPSAVALAIGGVVSELAAAMQDVTGFSGRVEWDRGKPDGTLLKRMDTQLINNMGWHPRIPFNRGLADTYAWFQEQGDLVRA